MKELITELINSSANVIIQNADELTKLDQAIGDGDHGINMKRGCEAILKEIQIITTLSVGEALQKIGMILIMKVGGASGPLFGSFFMEMGKQSKNSFINQQDLAIAFNAGVEAVKRRGKSDIGAKTMLDVLIPVANELQTASHDIFTLVRKTANKKLLATKDMLATKGRASFLGERSIGHIDPGAKTAALLINTWCNILDKK